MKLRFRDTTPTRRTTYGYQPVSAGEYVEMSDVSFEKSSIERSFRPE